MPTRRPVLGANFESNISGLYVVGDLAGAPVVKLAMEQGSDVAAYIASKPDAKSGDPNIYDLIVIGAGAAGLNAALGAQDRGLRVLVLEKNKIANTIEDFPEGKWVYAEPDSRPPKGKLWLDGTSKEELLGRWHQIIRENHLEVRVGEGVESLRKKDGNFEVIAGSTYRARRVVLATGQRGNPRRLGVPGEEQEQVYHRLYSPRHYRDEDILVVGGGNSAVEAALTLAEQNRVTLSYRESQFTRIFKDNRRRLEAALKSGSLKVIYRSEVRHFGEGACTLEVKEAGRRSTVELPYQHAFVLIGADAPTDFLRSMGIRLENDWTGNPLAALALVVAALAGIWVFGGKTNIPALAGQSLAGGYVALAALATLVFLGIRGSRFAWLGVSFVIAYTIYGAKQAQGFEFWPYRGWGAQALAFWNRPWSFWYTVLYTAVMTVFGLQAMKRWGFDKRDRFQIWRYASLISFQWVFFFLIPEFLFHWAVKYQWIGAKLAQDPAFTSQAWRAYGLVYAWPLFFYTFLGDPNRIWIVWGAALSFGLIPVLALFHGKRYCSWICGCGGLAETLGDRWRHLAPKGRSSVRWEYMNSIVLGAAVVVTLLVLGRDAVHMFASPSQTGLEYYHLFADVWLVGILPVTLYPFFGGKVWCRYWCPLAKMMQIFSAAFTRFRVSRFGIHANEKCIACMECTRNCQVGIDVMQYALKQEPITNANSSCIGCGICVTVCPMQVLSFSRQAPDAGLVQIAQAH
ncbi:MAG TPA: NAD(P)-binding domain-containing protein [Bryobacteraceae bacterium]|nr:NAD(P)-binding domain-containing protein [Bryobacteraceae bacterium]